MVVNATFNIFQLKCDRQFYCGRKPEYTEKATALPQITDKYDHIILYREHIGMSGIRIHNDGGYMH